MKRFLVLVSLLVFTTTGCTASSPERASNPTGSSAPFAFRVLTTGLADPWEINWAPDGFLWVTEKAGKRVTRINPADGAKNTVVTIADVYSTQSQDGLLGLAFQPDFLRGNNDVYVAYTYDADPGPAVDRRAKIVRYTYDQATRTLNRPVELIKGLPASTDHDAGRLLVGPDQKLYYSIGDQGNNQFNRACNPIRSQDLPTADDVLASNWETYQGKILRFNFDGGIPADNPVIKGVRSHIFTYGHRNPEGLAFGPGGRLFSTDHGPKADDEINLNEPGKNYGWPYVSGLKDGQGYVYENWSASTVPCASLHYDDFTTPPSVPRQDEKAWSSPDYLDPLKTLYTVPNGYNYQDPTCGDQSYVCWPSIAPSSMVYVPAGKGVFDGWSNSLLVTSLKNGAIYRLRLTQDGGSIQGDVTQYFKTANRYRALALSPDHRNVYILTDTNGLVASESGSPVEQLANPGAILEFSVPPSS
ncbi:MAG TPA: glucose/sorbosone family PQQ-dependent dehydrogenase [Pseudonocardiaceae bacterium]|jgi:PQQ-dependent dehydrogenase (s-GDH family)|nr:glucose/sorbosone family PQQ-dependent dehydrogenase [Pseudonocardiaceae bacterium]